MRIPSERGQTKASTRNCERKPTTRRATGARKSGRKVVTVDPMHTKAQTCNSNLIRGPCSSSGRGPVRFRRLLNLRNRSDPPLWPRPRRFAAQLVASRAEARRVCCSRGCVVCCSDGSGDHDDRSWVAFCVRPSRLDGPRSSVACVCRCLVEQGGRCRPVFVELACWDVHLTHFRRGRLS